MQSVDVTGALEEMNFEIVKVHKNFELPSSKPGSFEFSEPATLDVDAIESQLEDRDFTMFTPDYDTKENGAFYCYFTLMTDHYKKVKVRAWKNDVRVYPQEEPPDRYELSRIVQALESAFGAELTHEPLED